VNLNHANEVLYVDRCGHFDHDDVTDLERVLVAQVKLPSLDKSNMLVANKKFLAPTIVNILSALMKPTREWVIVDRTLRRCVTVFDKIIFIK